MNKTKGLILEREVLEGRTGNGCTTIPQAHYSRAFSATPQLELNNIHSGGAQTVIIQVER